MNKTGRRVMRLRTLSALRTRLALWCLAICAPALALAGILLAHEQYDILVSSLDAQMVAPLGSGLLQMVAPPGSGLLAQPAGGLPAYKSGGDFPSASLGFAYQGGAIRSGAIMVGEVASASQVSPGDDATVLRRLLMPPKESNTTVAHPSTGDSSAAFSTTRPNARHATVVGELPVRLDAPACTSLEGWRLCRIAARDGRGRLIWVAHLALQLSVLQPSIDTLRRWLLIVLPLVLVLATLGCWVLSSRALAPIDRLTREARRIGATDLRRRLGLAPRDDEVGRLAATLDEMLARLAAAFAQQQAFTAAASHELRTPLTIVRGDLDVLLERPRRPAEYQEALREMRGEVGRLSDLVEDLLTLARADSGTEQMAHDLVALDAIVAAACSNVQRLAHDGGIALELVSAPDLLVMGDGQRLRHMLLNLLDNAIRYTPPGGTVRVTLETHGTLAYVQVADTGIGVAPEDLPHIFDRFYRADAARSRASGGAGLGLALARWCVEAHGGTICVESQVRQGTRFTVSLPLALAAEDDEDCPDPLAPTA